MSASERQLFTAQQEKLVRTPVRPLGPLSDYVAETLPTELEAVRNSTAPVTILEARIPSLIEGASSQISLLAGMSDRERDIALMDLLFLQTAIKVSGGNSPSLLTETAERLSAEQGRIPTVTYEDLIFTNPLDTDPRLLLSGDAGATELDFYETHRRIESAFDTQIGSIRAALDTFSEAGSEPDIVDRITSTLTSPEAESARAVINKLMTIIGRDLEDAHFMALMTYFRNDPEGFKAASGAFSAAVPVIEVLLAGSRLPNERTVYHDENRQYFPRQGIADLDQAYSLASQGVSLIDCFESLGQPQEMLGALKDIDRSLQHFRGLHHKAVKTKAPDAYKGERAGSAGVPNVEPFLRERSRHTYMGRN